MVEPVHLSPRNRRVYGSFKTREEAERHLANRQRAADRSTSPYTNPMFRGQKFYHPKGYRDEIQQGDDGLFHVVNIKNIPVRPKGNPMDRAWSSLRSDTGTKLGGSTGARYHDLEDIGRFVTKRGKTPFGRKEDHVHNEYDMNQYLNALGVTVPEASLHEQKNWPVLMSRFQEGRPFDPSSSSQQEQLTRDFVPHAAIANWDMLGLDYDNLIATPEGKLSYVDLGGAGPFRAQGQPKGQAFGPTVGELDTLRQQNPLPLGHITEQDIGRSWDEYGGQSAFEDALQFLRNQQTQNTMQQRIEDIARRVA